MRDIRDIIVIAALFAFSFCKHATADDNTQASSPLDQVEEEVPGMAIELTGSGKELIIFNLVEKEENPEQTVELTPGSFLMHPTSSLDQDHDRSHRIDSAVRDGVRPSSPRRRPVARSGSP
jgi:hypothetical protein